jgi:integrase
MPRPRKEPRLWLKPAERDPAGTLIRAARWFIRDGGRKVSTGCGQGDRAEAERRLAAHLVEKYGPPRSARDLNAIPVADVINIYLADVAPGLARPAMAAERFGRLLDFFGDKTLADVNGALCRAYEIARRGQGRSNKGSGGGAKRDLEDLRAAINHHQAEGLHRHVVRVVLPPRGEPRQRWLSRAEVARLLWACWRHREVQEGRATDKRPLRHLCRFLLLAIYTGSRPGAVTTAAWDRGPGRSFVDVDRGVFYRLAEQAVTTNKRQPTVNLNPRLLAHLRRWKRLDGGRGFVVRFNGAGVASVKTAMNRATALAGLDAGVSAYTCRHTAATWLITQGVSIFDTAQFLGTSPAMIERHYAHLAPDYLATPTAAISRKPPRRG